MTNLVGGKTLKEIAEMPRREMLKHMQKYNHPDYGTCLDATKPEKDKEWEIMYSYTETIWDIFEGKTKEEAKVNFYKQMASEGTEDPEIISIEERND